MSTPPTRPGSGDAGGYLRAAPAAHQGLTLEEALHGVPAGWGPVVRQLYARFGRHRAPAPFAVEDWGGLAVLPQPPVSLRVARAIGAAQRLAARTCVVCGRRAPARRPVEPHAAILVPLCVPHAAQVDAHDGSLVSVERSRRRAAAHASEPARSLLLGEPLDPAAYREALAQLAAPRPSGPDAGRDDEWCDVADVVWVLDGVDAARLPEQVPALTGADLAPFLEDEDTRVREAAIAAVGRLAPAAEPAAPVGAGDAR